MPQNDDLIKSIQELLKKERGETRKIVREGVEVLENRMGKLEKGQQSLEQGQKKLETRMGDLEEGQGKLEKRMDTLEGGLTRVEKKLDKEIEAVAEFHTGVDEYINNKVLPRPDKIEDELNISHTS